MKTSPARPLPLLPLLRAYVETGIPDTCELSKLPILGRRFHAILGARGELLTDPFLEKASAQEFEAAIARFYAACVQPADHEHDLRRSAGIVRHALNYLLRSRDAWASKLENCVANDGVYRVAGLGPTFWSALLQAVDPIHNPAWMPGVLAGFVRLERNDWEAADRPSTVYSALLDAYAPMRSEAPALTALHIDHFLTLVAVTSDRRLASRIPSGATADTGSLTVNAVLAALGTQPQKLRSETAAFGGFCADTFCFLSELAGNNCREWMERERERYRFVVRQPLAELCRALAARYIEPVLRRKYGWDLETEARSGAALTSICKNDYGRSVPYQTELWITFHPRGRERRECMQFFVRVDAGGLSCGIRLGREAAEDRVRLRQNVQQHGELLFRALGQRNAATTCLVTADDDFTNASRIESVEQLREWSAGRTLIAGRAIPAVDGVLECDDLVGEIILTFDQLLPLFICAVEPEPQPLLKAHAGIANGHVAFTDADFCRETYLERDWLRRAKELLDLKGQLILQGVPGTGKTHVARALARWLTRGDDRAIRLVQFHPAFSYEEFVEGIKVRSVDVGGRHDVSYPVEEGLLSTFATLAAQRPEQPHALIIDEINRGNLPRIFGELMYLLEYREQSIALPYSKREFRLPANLYIVGTMNTADRSVALVDQALRRRFSFLDMPPDAAVLSAWLEHHPPTGESELAAKIIGLFRRLNARLRADLGQHYQIGHSYFMVPEFDQERLRTVWDHHVLPVLEEYFVGHPGRAARYEFDRLLNGTERRKRKAASSSR
jgi:5-methylcytosine-specific restriction enzyme B